MQSPDEPPPQDVLLNDDMSTDRAVPEDVLPSDESPKDRPEPEGLPMDHPGKNFAPPRQPIQAVVSVAEILRQTVSIFMYLQTMIVHNPAGSGQLASLAKTLLAHHYFFMAWCNNIRRHNLDDLRDLWQSRFGEKIEKLISDVLSLMQATNVDLTTALHWAVQEPADVLVKVNYSYHILRALLFVIEVRRYLNSLHWLFVQQRPESIDFQQSQPLLMKQPPEFF